MRDRIRAIGATVILALSACVWNGCMAAKYEDVAREQLLDEFRRGAAHLDCFYGCWLDEKLGENLLRARDYEELAYQVLRTGYDAGTSWRFLGLAAENLEYRDAALIYFRKSLTTGRLRIYSTSPEGLEVAARIRTLEASLAESDCPQKIVRTTQDATIRRGPGPQFPAARNAAAGDRLNCVARKGVWYKIESAGGEEWVYGGAVVPVAP